MNEFAADLISAAATIGEDYMLISERDHLIELVEDIERTDDAYYLVKNAVRTIIKARDLAHAVGNIEAHDDLQEIVEELGVQASA